MTKQQNALMVKQQHALAPRLTSSVEGTFQGYIQHEVSPGYDAGRPRGYDSDGRLPPPRGVVGRLFMTVIYLMAMGWRTLPPLAYVATLGLRAFGYVAFTSVAAANTALLSCSYRLHIVLAEYARSTSPLLAPWLVAPASTVGLLPAGITKRLGKGKQDDVSEVE